MADNAKQLQRRSDKLLCPTGWPSGLVYPLLLRDPEWPRKLCGSFYNSYLFHCTYWRDKPFIDVSTSHLPHNVVGSNMFKRKGSLCKTQHEKEKYWYTVLKNDKNVNHFKVEKEMHLNICIYNKKKFFFLFGEERCRKGHCIS